MPDPKTFAFKECFIFLKQDSTANRTAAQIVEAVKAIRIPDEYPSRPNPAHPIRTSLDNDENAYKKPARVEKTVVSIDPLSLFPIGRVSLSFIGSIEDLLRITQATVIIKLTVMDNDGSLREKYELGVDDVFPDGYPPVASIRITPSSDLVPLAEIAALTFLLHTRAAGFQSVRRTEAVISSLLEEEKKALIAGDAEKLSTCSPLIEKKLAGINARKKPQDPPVIRDNWIRHERDWGKGDYYEALIGTHISTIRQLVAEHFPLTDTSTEETLSGSLAKPTPPGDPQP